MDKKTKNTEWFDLKTNQSVQAETNNNESIVSKVLQSSKTITIAIPPDNTHHQPEKITPTTPKQSTTQVVPNKQQPGLWASFTGYVLDNITSTTCANVLHELEQKTFTDNLTNRLRLKNALQEYRTNDDYTNMQLLLGLCVKQKIMVDNTRTIQQCHKFLQNTKDTHEHDLIQVITQQLGNITNQANERLKKLQQMIEEETGAISQLLTNDLTTMNNIVATYGNTIRTLKQGQLDAHKLNTFRNNGYDSDDERKTSYYKNIQQYTDALILQKIEMDNKIKNIQSAIQNLSDQLAPLNTTAQKIKAITNQ